MPLSLLPYQSPLISQAVNDNLNYLDASIKNVVKDNIGYGIRTGLSVSAQTTPNMTVKVLPGVAYLPSGQRVQFSTETVLTIPNPSVVQHSSEPHTTDTSGVFTTDLKPITDSSGNYATISAITVRNASDNTVVTVESVDPVNGTVDTVLTAATNVKIDYFHGQQRIDIIVINSSGALQVISGTPADSNPQVPTTPTGAIKLAEIKVNPKANICIESTDITNIIDAGGLKIDDNLNVVVFKDLVVLGSQVVGNTVQQDIIVRGNIYNDQTSQPVTINDDVSITGNITITGTVDGRDISIDGATLDTHIVKQVDPTSTDTTKDKHLSNALAKGWEDHKNSTGNPHSTQHNQLLNIPTVDVTSTDTVLDKHISNALAKGWEDHKNSPHLQLGETSTTAYRGDRGASAYSHSITVGNPHSTTHAQLVSVLGANPASTDTTKDKHISDQMAKQWEDHRLNTSNPHNTTAAQVGALVSINSITNAGGNIDLIAGSNISISADTVNKKITITGSGTWPDSDTLDTLHADDFLCQMWMEV
jgi:hypothetical protein